MSNYRSVIYERYASQIKAYPPEFDVGAADRWGRAYDYYFRSWLPASPGAAVLDLACGGGHLLHYFRRRGYENLSGVDVSPDQVRLARQVVPDVVQGDVLDYLDAHPAVFDVITALDLIEHFGKDELLRFLDGCYAALKPGGRLILQTPNADSPWGIATRYSDLTHETCLNTYLARRLFALAGYEQFESREQGPVPRGSGPKAAVRSLLWQPFRWAFQFWNLVETGDRGSGVFTRVFLISATRPTTPLESSR